VRLNKKNLQACSNAILVFMGREPDKGFSYDSLESVLDDFSAVEVQWSYNNLIAAEYATEESGISLSNDKYGLKLTKLKGREKARKLRGNK
jgi:hypothetical protein